MCGHEKERGSDAATLEVKVPAGSQRGNGSVSFSCAVTLLLIPDLVLAIPEYICMPSTRANSLNPHLEVTTSGTHELFIDETPHGKGVSVSLFMEIPHVPGKWGRENSIRAELNRPSLK
ncbi:hypothetical protein CEXT_59091 [Caerostris extrusa]|uniref:Uncharacterized protein n=1 Tax=Caerostris extrusa TaxID=172846 RepID=A0AAV4MV34_CAEEX|nr:hypothetical protein CEXT_59091 [Caerostris extrusa]